jgi:histidinol-phosphate aminotransferase
MTRLTRADLETLPAYVPGRAAPGAIKLASNEVPFGPLPGVLEAITAAAANVNRYPDMGVVELRQALADRNDIDPDRIATGCGSVAITEHLVRAVCVPGDEVVYSWRSFEAYPIITATTGVTSIKVPNTAEHGHDLPAMADAITDRTRLVLVCNPNNPTGTVVRRAAIDDFLDRVPQNVVVVLDEAYHEFVTDPEVPDGIAAYDDRRNVAVLRTLSKAWGLAGLRLGYLVAHPEVAAAVRKVVTPFSSSMLAQAAGLAALRADDEMRRRVAIVVSERERLLDGVRKVYPEVPDSQGNFVWLPLGDRTTEVAASFEKAGILTRPFAGDGIRVTVGTPEENDALLAALT